MNDPQTNAVTLNSGTPRNSREALFQQTIKDLTQRNQTLAHKCSGLQLALNAALARRNIAESERDCARRELSQVASMTPRDCRHERLDEDGICRHCGADCRGLDPATVTCREGGCQTRSQPHCEFCGERP